MSSSLSLRLLLQLTCVCRCGWFLKLGAVAEAAPDALTMSYNSLRIGLSSESLSWQILHAEYMRLSRIEVRNYKRFRDSVTLRITGKLTAVVGANEAGKTSLLRAIEHLTSEEAFEAVGQGAEISRGANPAPSDILVEAFFALDDGDRELIADIAGVDQVRWFSIGQRLDGEIVKNVVPKLKRDLGPRQRMRSQMERLLKSPSLDDLSSTEDEQELSELLADCLSDISSDDENLDKAAINRLSHVASILSENEETLPKYARGIVASLGQLIEHERLAAPSERAARKLWKASPDFLFYQDEDRTLASAYTLPSVAGKPPPALRNLAQLADLDLQALEGARAEDEGLVETLIEQANQRLRTAMESWGQGAVSVRLRLDAETLRILVATEQAGFWTLEDRSDGLRAFIALRAFLGARPQANGAPPILLIDEAEAHLHYDAQADLIQVWTLQRLVPQIIYTTHSAGCLPEDLASVRTVRPTGPEVSTIDNWFWQGEDPGIASLLLGLGAATMAFVPTRYAVVGEGAADVVLLPTLLREVSHTDSLGFQVVPGGAEVSGAEVTSLKRQAPRVLWVVDNDQGGQDNAATLRAGGVSDEHILKACEDPHVTIEDLLHPDVYLEAVNYELQAAGKDTMTSADLGDGSGRVDAVKSWCRDRDFDPPSQRAIAHRLLAIRSESDKELLSQNGRAEAHRLLEAIQERFGVDN